MSIRAFLPAGAKHAFGIELERNFAAIVDGDEASLALMRRQLLEYDLARRGADAAPAVAHARADIVRDRATQKYFSVSRGRYCAGAVIGISTRADDGRIADSLKALAGHAPGRGRGSQMTMAVERDRSHGTYVRDGVPG